MIPCLIPLRSATCGTGGRPANATNNCVGKGSRSCCSAFALARIISFDSLKPGQLLGAPFPNYIKLDAESGERAVRSSRAEIGDGLNAGLVLPTHVTTPPKEQTLRTAG